MDDLKNIARDNIVRGDGYDIDFTCPFQDKNRRPPMSEYCQIYCGRVFEEWRVRHEMYRGGFWVCPCDFYTSVMFVEVRFWAWLNG